MATPQVILRRPATAMLWNIGRWSALAAVVALLVWLVVAPAPAPGRFTLKRKIAVGVAGAGALVVVGAVIAGVQARGFESDAHALCSMTVCTDADQANTLLGMAIDVETFRPKLASVTGGLSGPAIRPVAVRCVHEVARALPAVPLIGIGGVTEVSHALELLMAGAWAVQVGTANFFEPDATITIAEGIGSFLTRKGIPAVADLRGMLQLPNRVAEPAYRRG